jgi:hypothetical protein
VSGKASVLGEDRILVDSLTELHALDLGSGEVAWSVSRCFGFQWGVMVASRSQLGAPQ